MSAKSRHWRGASASRRMAQRHAQPIGTRAVALPVVMRWGITVGTLAMVVPGAWAQSTASTANSHASTESSETVTMPSVMVQADASFPVFSGGQVSTESYLGFLGDKDFMDTPFSTITYTEKYMADQQARDISEVIAKSDPTVFISGIAGESNEGYSIRGLPSNVGDVTVNGLAGMAAFYRNSPEMFERAEVLKGPSALLNGMLPKGSVGGAVNLVTKRAKDDPNASTTLTYTSDSQFGGHVDIGRRFGEHNQLGIRFNGLYRNGETAVKTQDKMASQFALGVDWRGERARLSMDLYQSEDRAHGLTRGLTLAPGLGVPTPPNPDISTNPPWAFFKTTDQTMMVRGEYDVTDQLMAYAALGASHTTYDSNMGVGQIFNQAGDMRINFSGVSDKIDRKSVDLGVNGTATTGEVGHQFAVNYTYYYEDYRLNGFRNLLPQNWVTNIYSPTWGPEPALPANIPALTRTKTHMSSLGAADTLLFMQERLQLTLGLRYQSITNETYNGTTGVPLEAQYQSSAVTPAAGVVFKATEWLSLYANYIEGLSPGAIAPTTAANAGEVFAPYKTKQAELGFKVDLGDFSHTVSLYEIKRPNSYTDPVTNVFSFGGEQRNRGVEWGFFGEPLKGVRLIGGVAYSDPVVTKAVNPANEGKIAVGLPMWQGKLGVEWDLPVVSGLTLTANATAASKQYLDASNDLSIAGRVIFDVGARYTTQISGHPLILRAVVTNVGNTAYWAKPNFSSLAVGAPRTVMLSATLEY